MNCEWFEARLDELLDERLPPNLDDELNAHAELCPTCARLLTSYEGMLDGIELLAAAGQHQGFAEQVLQEVRETSACSPSVLSRPYAAVDAGICRPDTASRPPSRRSARSAFSPLGWSAAAIAATVLISIGVWRLHSGNLARPAAQSSPNSDLAGSGNPHAKPFPSENGHLAVQAVEEIPASGGAIGARPRSLMEQMSDGLKPVTNSMSAALHALRRALPGSEAPARSSWFSPCQGASGSGIA